MLLCYLQKHNQMIIFAKTYRTFNNYTVRWKLQSGWSLKRGLSRPSGSSCNRYIERMTVHPIHISILFQQWDKTKTMKLGTSHSHTIPSGKYLHFIKVPIWKTMIYMFSTIQVTLTVFLYHSPLQSCSTGNQYLMHIVSDSSSLSNSPTLPPPSLLFSSRVSLTPSRWLWATDRGTGCNTVPPFSLVTLLLVSKCKLPRAHQQASKEISKH